MKETYQRTIDKLTAFQLVSEVEYNQLLLPNRQSMTA